MSPGGKYVAADQLLPHTNTLSADLIVRTVLRWRPGVVQIGGDPDIALSKGPFILEDLRPGAASRWRVGQFQSVWVRDRTSGVWRVLFDAGTGPPRAVESLEAARRYVAANSPLDCPAG